MDGPRDYNTKQSKSERERQISYDITYMCNLKYDINQHISETRADSVLWLPRGGGREGKNWELGIRRGKLLYVEWINKKFLLYSTWNYIQYPVINHNGKEYEKAYRYMGFPGSSADKESAYNARDSSLIPGSGRSPEDGKGYLLQYSWASLMA